MSVVLSLQLKTKNCIVVGKGYGFRNGIAGRHLCKRQLREEAGLLVFHVGGQLMGLQRVTSHEVEAKRFVSVCLRELLW